jgi:hypothetical protein
VAIAAVVATLTVARQRSEARPAEPEQEPGGAPAASRLDLDALRAAGL